MTFHPLKYRWQMSYNEMKNSRTCLTSCSGFISCDNSLGGGHTNTHCFLNKRKKPPCAIDPGQFTFLPILRLRTGYPLNNFIGTNFSFYLPQNQPFMLNTLVTTFKTLNKKSINTVDRRLRSTVIWRDSIGYSFITLEPQQSLKHYQFCLYPSKDRKFGMTRS